MKTVVFRVSVILPEAEEGNQQDEDMIEEMLSLVYEGIEDIVKKSGLKLNEVTYDS
jgi:hypothetical protein